MGPAVKEPGFAYGVVADVCICADGSCVPIPHEESEQDMAGLTAGRAEPEPGPAAIEA